jgi:hypothetical protein
MATRADAFLVGAKAEATVEGVISKVFCIVETAIDWTGTLLEPFTAKAILAGVQPFGKGPEGQSKCDKSVITRGKQARY